MSLCAAGESRRELCDGPRTHRAIIDRCTALARVYPGRDRAPLVDYAHPSAAGPPVPSPQTLGGPSTAFREIWQTAPRVNLMSLPCKGQGIRSMSLTAV